jgi:hypothetical protein
MKTISVIFINYRALTYSMCQSSEINTFRVHAPFFSATEEKVIFTNFLCLFNRRKNEKVLLSGLGTHGYKSFSKNQQVIQIVIYQRQIQEVIIATDSNGGEKLL